MLENNFLLTKPSFPYSGSTLRQFSSETISLLQNLRKRLFSLKGMINRVFSLHGLSRNSGCAVRLLDIVDCADIGYIFLYSEVIAIFWSFQDIYEPFF